ncbi:GIN domain-containing protein [Flavobacterium sp. HNIBRBA15423]|uniref:GIN domain-containing protein n=1 Tax=Flavobacterium sp. HNIBRBA15423 TaxID=3458683 RepID=UPI004043A0D4
MKQIAFLLLVLFASTISLAQKKDKIKGSKIITHTIKEVESFENIEIEDNVEIYLVKADTPSIEIEADDNLHDVVNFSVTGNTLRITTLKTVSSAKKFDLRINYATTLKLITVKNEAKLHALNALQLDSITIKNFDNSASYLNVNSNSFTLILNDKSEAEINVKSQNTTLELSKNAELKALIASPEVKIDLYEKAEAKIEGDATNAKIRLDNNAILTANKFSVASIDLTVENYAKCEVNAVNDIAISASGKTQIELFGEPKIEMRKFTNSTTLYKKEK